MFFKKKEKKTKRVKLKSQMFSEAAYSNTQYHKPFFKEQLLQISHKKPKNNNLYLHYTFFIY